MCVTQVTERSPDCLVKRSGSTILLTDGAVTGDRLAAGRAVRLQPPLELPSLLCVRSQVSQERERVHSAQTSLSCQASLQLRLAEVKGVFVIHIGVISALVSLVAGLRRDQPVSHCNQSLISH